MIQQPGKLVELKPTEWRRYEPPPYKPTFGQKLQHVFAYAVSAAIAFTLTYWLRH